MKFFVRILLLTLVLLWLSSCRQEDELPQPPIVNFSSPQTNQFFEYGDTLFVRANISFASAGYAVKVSLLDENQVAVVAPVIINSVSGIYELNTWLVFDNPEAASGKYQIQLKVIYGEYSWNEWVDVQLIELEKRFLSLIIVTQPSPGNYSVYQDDLNNPPVLLFRYTGDFSDAAVQHVHNRLIIAGKEKTGILVWDLIRNESAWTIETVPGAPAQWLYGFYSSEAMKQIFFSGRDGLILGYDAFGRSTFRSEKVDNGVFTEILASGNGVLSAFEPFGGQPGELVRFSHPAGIITGRLNVQGKIHRFFLSGNTSGFIAEDKGKFSFYTANNSLADFSMLKIRELPVNALAGFTSDNSGNLFLGSENSIYWYRTSNNSFVPFTDYPGVQHLAFDNVNSLLFASGQNKIRYFGFPDFFISEERVYPEEVVAVMVRYNK